MPLPTRPLRRFDVYIQLLYTLLCITSVRDLGIGVREDEVFDRRLWRIHCKEESGRDLAGVKE